MFALFVDPYGAPMGPHMGLRVTYLDPKLIAG